MRSKKLLKLNDLQQVAKLSEQIDSSLTPDAEKPVLYLTLGIIHAEFRFSGADEIDLEHANRIFNEKRISEIKAQAISLIESYRRDENTKQTFLIGFFSSLSANILLAAIGGLVALSALLGNLDTAIDALEGIRATMQ